MLFLVLKSQKPGLQILLGRERKFNATVGTKGEVLLTAQLTHLPLGLKGQLIGRDFQASRALKLGTQKSQGFVSPSIGHALRVFGLGLNQTQVIGRLDGPGDHTKYGHATLIPKSKEESTQVDELVRPRS